MIVVDASAAVEYLLQTELGQRITGLIADASLVAPELLDVEVLSVLRREVAARRLPEDRASEAVEDLAAWGIERVRHRKLLRDAWQLRGHVSAYDALYVSLARQRGASLLTADGMLARAPGLGITVQNVRSI